MDQGVSINSKEETPDAKSKGKGKAREVIAEASTKDEESQEDGKEKDKLQVSKKKAARRVVDDEAPPRSRHSSTDWDMSDLHNAVDFPTQDPLTETDGPSLMDITDGEVPTTDDDGLLTSELGKDINFEARLLLNVLPRSLVQGCFDGGIQR